MLFCLREKLCVKGVHIAADVEKYGGLPIPWNPWDGRTVSFREGKSDLEHSVIPSVFEIT